MHIDTDVLAEVGETLFLLAFRCRVVRWDVNHHLWKINTNRDRFSEAILTVPLSYPIGLLNNGAFLTQLREHSWIYELIREQRNNRRNVYILCIRPVLNGNG